MANSEDPDKTTSQVTHSAVLDTLFEFLDRSDKDNGEGGFVCVVCVEVLRPSQPNEVMSSAVSLPKHTFTGQA